MSSSSSDKDTSYPIKKLLLLHFFPLALYASTRHCVFLILFLSFFFRLFLLVTLTLLFLRHKKFMLPHYYKAVLISRQCRQEMLVYLSNDNELNFVQKMFPTKLRSFFFPLIVISWRCNNSCSENPSLFCTKLN